MKVNVKFEDNYKAGLGLEHEDTGEDTVYERDYEGNLLFANHHLIVMHINHGLVDSKLVFVSGDDEQFHFDPRHTKFKWVITDEREE